MTNISFLSGSRVLSKLAVSRIYPSFLAVKRAITNLTVSSASRIPKSAFSHKFISPAELGTMFLSLGHFSANRF